MKIERTTPILFEGGVSKKTLIQLLVPVDDRAREFLDNYQGQSYEELILERYADSYPAKDVTIATGVTDDIPLRKAEWYELEKEGWRFASLIHWYLYREICKTKDESLILGGTVYRDEALNEWVPIVTLRHKILGRSIYEIAMRQRVPLPALRKHTRMLLIKIAGKSK